MPTNKCAPARVLGILFPKLLALPSDAQSLADGRERSTIQRRHSLRDEMAKFHRTAQLAMLALVGLIFFAGSGSAQSMHCDPPSPPNYSEGSTDNCSCTNQSVSYEGTFGSSYWEFDPVFQMVSGSNGLTIEMWVNPEDGLQSPLISAYGGSSGDNYRFTISSLPSTASPRFLQLRSFKSGVFDQVIGDIDVPTNEWSHVAFTYDGAAAAFYVNGEPAGGGAFNPGADLLSRIDLGRSGNDYYEGEIDELKVWDYARSAAQIQDNYLLSDDPFDLPSPAYYQNFENWHQGDAASIPSGRSGITLTHDLLFLQQGGAIASSNCPVIPFSSSNANVPCSGRGTYQCSSCDCFNPANLSSNCIEGYVAGIFPLSDYESFLKTNCSGDPACLLEAAFETAAWLQTNFEVFSLEADVGGISSSAGGSQNLFVHAGEGHAGDGYWMLGSASGTTPGLTLQGLPIPLNFDYYSSYTVKRTNSPYLVDSLGFLDSVGRGSMTINIPGGTGLAPGMAFDHAVLLFDPTLTNYLKASSTDKVTMLP